MNKALAYLREFRQQARFSSPQWKNYGPNSSPGTIADMTTQANNLVDFLIDKLETGTSQTDTLTPETINFIHSSGFMDNLESEEREWLYREVIPVLEQVGVDPDSVF